jgi:heat shock protein HtpX
MWNQVKTVFLLASITGVLVVVGGVYGGRFGMIAGLAIGAVMNLGAWWKSDSLVRAMTGAQIVPHGSMPELHAMVEELALRAQIPKPQLLYVDDPTPNAFATGRSPQRAAVAVTRGLVQTLDERELRGVLAHEFAHIIQRDTLISALTATLAGAITMLANMAQWAAIFGGGRDEDGQHPIALMATAFLAPIAALLIQMAISRTREYRADATGARLAQDPLALASALERIDQVAQRQAQHGIMHDNPSTAHLMIHGLNFGGLRQLFATHPPMAERVRRLRAMASQPLR